MLTLRTKIILLSVMSSFFVIVVLYAIIIYTYSSEVYQDVDRNLMSQTRDVINSLNFDKNARLIMTQKIILPQKTSSNSARYGYLIRDKNLQIVRRSIELIAVEIPEPDILKQRTKSFKSLQFNKREYRVYNSFYNKKSDLGRELYVIQLVVDLNYARNRVTELNRVLLWSIPVPLFLIGLAAWWLATNSLKPVKQLISTIENINARDFSARIKIHKNDEIGQIAAAFNAMFNRIKLTFDSLTRFTADASHELRTPLTSLKTQAEVILAQKRSAAEYRETISTMLEDLSRLEHLLNLLLELARSDAGLVQYQFKRCNLSELTGQWVEHFRPLTEERQMLLEKQIHPGIYAEVDNTLFERILINLIENAIEYSNKNSKISVELDYVPPKNETNAQVLHTVELRISNQGKSIADKDKKRIFERFVRLDRTRHKFEGSGLGLPIVKWAVKAHKGNVQVMDGTPDGVIFVVQIPVKP